MPTLTYAELIHEIAAEVPPSVHELAALYDIDPREVEAALELLVRRHIARRVRHADPKLGLTKTRWVLIGAVDGAIDLASSLGMNVRSPVARAPSDA